MEIMPASLAFVVAAGSAGIMGFAIQRGATCTVVAVEEILTRGRARRLVAMVEASLWVAGGLLVAHALGLLGRMPAGYPLGGTALLGGALLGLGAFVNRACVFGAIARFGSGEWAFAFTPLGFYVGCVSFGLLPTPPTAQPLPDASPILQAPGWVAALVAAAMAWRIAGPIFARRPRASGIAAPAHWHRALAARVWAPHAATTVIALTFLVLLLVAGPWSYTDALAELARGMAHSLPARTLLLLAMLLGAVLGGWTAGRFRNTRLSPARLLRCFAGGMVMAWGGLLVPGSNDGLILLGMPLLWPYAWVAFLAMCGTIAAAIVLKGRWSQPLEPPLLTAPEAARAPDPR
jgi:hypothetical protein